MEAASPFHLKISYTKICLVVKQVFSCTHKMLLQMIKWTLPDNMGPLLHPQKKPCLKIGLILNRKSPRSLPFMKSPRIHSRLIQKLWKSLMTLKNLMRCHITIHHTFLLIQHQHTAHKSKNQRWKRVANEITMDISKELFYSNYE